MMERRLRYLISIAAGLIVLAFLIWLTVVTPLELGVLLPWVFFSALLAFTTTVGVFVAGAGGSVSLLPMTTVAAFLVMGLVPAGWAACVGALAYGLIRYRWANWLGLRRAPDRLGLFGLTAANIAIQAVGIIAGGAVFRALGGTTPLATTALSDLLPLLFLCLTYLVVNHLVAAAYIAARGSEPLRLYLRSLPSLVLYEGGPLLFAPLMALIYTRLGVGQFTLFALVLVTTSLITRNLAFTSRRLERRVKELDSLQVVGQALSASLRVETILAAIYDQVAGLMPARNFYVALYDPASDEVSFPLAVENGEQVRWRSRRMGSGLTEYVLQTREPLLLRRDVSAGLKRLGIDEIGRAAESWLGVPILAGDEPLGIIAVQSYATPGVYDLLHQEVLVTIAAQASVAIQNAHLYARTDEALARRVQELDSILRTAREGLLLLDPEWRVLAVNRALANFLGVAQLELTDQPLDAPRPDGGESLLTLLGYTSPDLQADCEALARGEEEARRVKCIVPGPPERHVERTLTPVRDQEGAIAGWLLVFRDLTEEIELERLRDDTTHMLVHDLRSPLTVMKGSLDLMEVAFARRKADEFDNMVGMARRGNARMLDLVNQLLDINRLESGEMPLHTKAVEIRPLLEDVVARFSPLATEAQIVIAVSVEPDLPPLWVDPGLIGRVLSNLVDNAIKFAPDGGRVQLWARPDRDGNLAAVLVGVSDDGPGIPSEDQARLFVKFRQVISEEGRRAGTGLGLPFCRLAVEAHGGQIWVESEVGKGSTFSMRLPCLDRGRQG